MIEAPGIPYAVWPLPITTVKPELLHPIMDAQIKSQAKILIVDDDAENTRMLARSLRLGGYECVETMNDSRGVVAFFIEYEPDLVILDLMMPHLDGFQLLNLFVQLLDDITYMPVMVLSANNTLEAKERTLSCGAMDFVSKPFEPLELMLRVNNLLRTRFLHRNLEEEVVRRTQQLEEYELELKETQIEVVDRLALAAERRDDDTGQHTQRVGLIAMLLGQTLGMPEKENNLLRRAATLHDVGKIGIPDSILLKPGLLTDDERTIMKTHCTIGGGLLAEGHSDLVQKSQIIAYSHHEKWDGSGYPQNLQGDEIPIEGRLLAIADVFDALTHDRPYKYAWPVVEAVDEICSQRGRHFDPQVVDAFLTLPHADLI